MFVTLLFRESLGRNPTAAEVQWQAGNLARTTRGRLAANFLSGPEFLRYREALLNALHAYFVILARDPSAAEAADAESRLRSGTPFAAILAALLASAEHRSLLQ